MRITIPHADIPKPLRVACCGGKPALLPAYVFGLPGSLELLLVPHRASAGQKDRFNTAIPKFFKLITFLFYCSSGNGQINI